MSAYIHRTKAEEKSPDSCSLSSLKSWLDQGRRGRQGTAVDVVDAEHGREQGDHVGTGATVPRARLTPPCAGARTTPG